MIFKASSDTNSLSKNRKAPRLKIASNRLNRLKSGSAGTPFLKANWYESALV
jgi:hypothetical protein